MNSQRQPTPETAAAIEDLSRGLERAERLTATLSSDKGDLDSYFKDLADGWWHAAAHAATWTQHAQAKAIAEFIETNLYGLSEKVKADRDAFETHIKTLRGETLDPFLEE